MKNFISVNDIVNIEQAITEALEIKADPTKFSQLGKGKTLGLIFLNPSLRTRVSTQIAAQNLGMNVIIINAGQDAWTWELEDGVVMNTSTVEHIKDAAKVMSEYCDIIGIRCFPTLDDKNKDVNEEVLNRFLNYVSVPVISLESATLHPLQSFADMLTIKENWKENRKPKVVLTWAPHIKAIPHAVANSFAEWIDKTDVDFVVTHPKGYELDTKFVSSSKIEYNQELALSGADFVYVKNWSSFENYGEMPEVTENWLLSNKKLEITNEAKIMHCLPVRRNVELADEVLDSENSIVYKQAKNRVFSAQYVLKKILENA